MAQDMILLAQADHLIDDGDECLLWYDLNQSINLDLPYHSYENFDLNTLSDDDCKSLDSIKGKYSCCVTFLKYQKKLGVIIEWILTEKKLYVFS